MGGGGVWCVLGILGIPSISREPGVLGVLSFGGYRDTEGYWE